MVGGTGQMRRRRELTFLAVLLVAGGVIPRTAALAATPFQPGIQASGSAVKLLYNWKFPASGQRGAWTFDKAVLAYDGESNAGLFAPFRLKRLANFAVQATVQGLGAGGPQANLIVRGSYREGKYTGAPLGRAIETIASGAQCDVLIGVPGRLGRMLTLEGVAPQNGTQQR